MGEIKVFHGLKEPYEQKALLIEKKRIVVFLKIWVTYQIIKSSWKNSAPYLTKCMTC